MTKTVKIEEYIESLEIINDLWVDRETVLNDMKNNDREWSKIIILLLTDNTNGRISRKYLVNKLKVLKELMKVDLGYQILYYPKQQAYLRNLVENK